MAAGIAINIDDHASPAMRRFGAVFGNPTPLLNVMGREGANQLRRHFRERDQTNASFLGSAGGRRQHFWLDIMRSVSAPQVKSADTVTVSITDPRFAQKLYGGTIRAKRFKFLAIPVDPQAYGRRAGKGGQFEVETGLKLIFLRQNNEALLATKEKEGAFQVRYVLRRSVNQKPDPEALPDPDELGRQVAARAERFIDRKLQAPGETS